MNKSCWFLFHVTCVLLFAAAITFGYILRDADPFSRDILSIILGLGFTTALIANLFLGFIPRWRCNFLPVSLFCIAAILLVGVFITANIYFQSWNPQMARDYVATIQPRLENFRRTHGHYPDSLLQITGLPPIPLGLAYRHEHFNFEDTYRFLYWKTYEYWSGQWIYED